MYDIKCALIIINYLLRNNDVILIDIFKEYIKYEKDERLDDWDIDGHFAQHQGRVFRNTITKLKDETIIYFMGNRENNLNNYIRSYLKFNVAINDKKLATLQGIYGFNITELLDDYLFKEKIKILPLWGKPQKCNADIFVIMPFLKKFKHIYDNHIKKVCTEMSLKCMRADDIFSSKPVMSDIWNYINSAKVILCDCTTRNPNVFYELGIAHTIGKDVILFTQNERDIPFDIKHLKYIKYRNTTRGMDDFENSLKQFIRRAMCGD
jgi:hypothetical protein